MLTYNPKSGRPLAVGSYTGTITKVTERKSSKGEPQYAVTLSADESSTTMFITLNEGGTPFLAQLADALGEPKSFDDGTFDPNDHVGTELEFEVVEGRGGFTNVRFDV